MNQINPLHIGALLVTLLAFLVFELSGVKSELRDAKKEFAKSEKLAVDLSSLKSVYNNPVKTKRALKRILAQSSLRAEALDVKYKKDFVKISAKSVSAKTLNSLLGKILNGSYRVTELKIKRLSKTKASLEMEIKW